MYCEQRNAHALLKHLLYCEVNCLKVLVHAKCRRDFTDPKRQKPLTDDPVQVKRLRSSLPDFSWKTCCFFCRENAKIDPRHPNKNLRAAQTLTFRNSVMQQCDIRKDPWADEVRGRLLDCIDLVAAEGIYHRNCCSLFFKEVGERPVGRAPNVELSIFLIDFVYGWKQSVKWNY